MVSSHEAQEDPDEEDEQDEHLDDDAAIAAHNLVIPDENKRGTTQERGGGGGSGTTKGKRNVHHTSHNAEKASTQGTTETPSRGAQDIHLPKNERAHHSISYGLHAREYIFLAWIRFQSPTEEHYYFSTPTILIARL